MNELESAGKLVSISLCQIGMAVMELGKAILEESKKLDRDSEQLEDSFAEKWPAIQSESQSGPMPVIHDTPKEKAIPKDNFALYKFEGKYQQRIRACKEGKRYFIIIRDACMFMGLCESTSSIIYYALPHEYRAKARIKIKGQTKMVNVALQRPLLLRCKKMGYDTSRLEKYFNRGGKHFVIGSCVEDITLQ